MVPEPAPPDAPDAAIHEADGEDAGPALTDADTPADAGEDAGLADTGPFPDAGPPSLSIRFLGVGGFSIASGGDRIVTPPLYSNPPLDDVLAGSVRADAARIDRLLDAIDLGGTRAFLIGHAHYDHLMDLPYVYRRTPDAMIYGNVDAKRLLAAFAPDRSPGCPTSTAALPEIARDRVVAVNGANDAVDYRMCAEPRSSCGGAWDRGEGSWIHVPNSRVRVRALCSEHPDQFLFFHLGGGCVDEDACAPPSRAADWREGATVSWLVDFLDDAGAPVFRVYYQDAPTNAPVGHPHPDLLAEKRIDVAILCVGNYDQVADQPQATIAALSPRHVVAGHWESFFRSPEEPPTDIPFLDVDEYVRRMNEALGDPSRATKPDPGAELTFAPE